MAHERALRLVTLGTTALATPFLIAITVLSIQTENYRWHGRRVTTFCVCFFPLAMTAAASIISLLHYRRHGRMPNFRFALLDVLAAITYLAMLIAVWSVEIARLRGSQGGLLTGYATAPMMLNMVAHGYIFMLNAKSISSWMFSEAEHECPNCRSKFTAAPEVAQTTSKSGEIYSLLRGEDHLDDDAMPYTDERTSEDQIGVAGNADIGDKGKDRV
ncbi:hypothetical protein GQ44DRAFT_769631 [Phaeosphaeriaceae sp. PMI808]|nr:hypothetical protein GQ44DRAFT_769631 [Phaeosphaeriaceae sp. PMI808]